MKKVALFVFISFVILINYATASEVTSSHKMAAERLFIAMDIDKTLTQMIDSMLKMEIQKNQQLTLYEGVMRRFFLKYLSYEALKDDMVRIYTDELTEENLNKTAEFFSSPAGKKFSEKQAVLFQKGAMLGQSRVNKNIEELKKMIEIETERLKSLQNQSK